MFMPSMDTPVFPSNWGCPACPHKGQKTKGLSRIIHSYPVVASIEPKGCLLCCDTNRVNAQIFVHG